jgi:hypothetical protein
MIPRLTMMAGAVNAGGLLRDSVPISSTHQSLYGETVCFLLHEIFCESLHLEL